MSIDEDLLRAGLRPEQALPAPIRPLGPVQRRARALRRRRRLGQAGGAAVLSTALALGIGQAGLPWLGGTDHAVPATTTTEPSQSVGRWTVPDAVPLLFAPDRALSGPAVEPPQFFDSSQACADARTLTMAYHAEAGLVRDTLEVEGPYSDGLGGEPPGIDGYGPGRAPQVRTVEAGGRPVTLAEWTTPPDTTWGHWRDADGRWWRAVVQGLGGRQQREQAILALRPSGRTVLPGSIPAALEVRPAVVLPDGCQDQVRDLAVVQSFGPATRERGGWWLEVSDTGAPDRLDSHLMQRGARITEVGGRPAVWTVNDTPTPPEGGEDPSRNLFWRDAEGHEFEIGAGRMMSLERAVQLAESVHRVTPDEAGVPASDLTNRTPIQTK